MARVIPIIVPDVLYKAVGGQNFMQMLPLQRKTKSMEYIIFCLSYNVMVFIKRFIAGILFYICELCTFLLNVYVYIFIHKYFCFSFFLFLFCDSYVDGKHIFGIKMLIFQSTFTLKI